MLAYWGRWKLISRCAVGLGSFSVCDAAEAQPANTSNVYESRLDAVLVISLAPWWAVGAGV